MTKALTMTSINILSSKKFIYFFLSLFFLLLLLFTGLHTAKAASLTWTGNGAPDLNWSNPLNWLDDSVPPVNATPANGDNLFFPINADAFRKNMVDDLSGLSINSIYLVDSGYIFSGTQPLKVSLGGIIDTANGGQNDINIPIVINNNIGDLAIISNGSNHTLNMGGSIDLNHNNLIFNGKGYINVFNSINDSISCTSTPCPTVTIEGTDPNIHLYVFFNADSTYYGKTIIKDSSYLGITTIGALGYANNDDDSGTVVETGTTYGGQLDLRFPSGSTLNNENLTLEGPGISGNGALGSISADRTWAGSISIGNNGATINVDQNLTLSGNIIGGAIYKEGSSSGILKLSGNNSFSGLTNAGGIVQVNSTGAIPNNIPVTAYFTTTLDLNNYNVTLASIFEPGGVQSNINLGSGNTPGTLTLNNDVPSEIHGVISGNGNINKDGLGTLTLFGQNTFTGGVTITKGALKLAGPGIIPDSSQVNIQSAGILDMNGQNERIGALEGQTGAQIMNSSAIVSTLLAGSADSDSTFSHTYAGTINGDIGFVKQGPGKLIFNGDNNYTSTTLIEGGTLIVDGNQPQSDINLNAADAVLGGSGTVGNVDMHSPGATVAPGNSTAILNTKNINFPAGTFLKIEINGTTAGIDYDQLNVDGTVTIDNNAELILTGTMTSGATYKIVKATGAITGTFKNKPDNSQLTYNDKTYTIKYKNEVNDHSITLTVANPPTPPSSAPASSGGGSGAVNWPTTYSLTVDPALIYSTSENKVRRVPLAEENTNLHPAAEPKVPSTRQFFKDVYNNSAEPDIYELLKNCKVAGYKDEQGNFLQVFRPDNQITRAELLVMIIKCKYGPMAAPNYAPFLDVPALHWSAPYVAKAKELGILKGYDDGSFKPDQIISKAEALKAILLGWFPLSEIQAVKPTVNTCKDVSPTSWYFQYFSFALLHKFQVNIYYCQPEAYLSRAESATLVVKVKRYQP